VLECRFNSFGESASYVGINISWPKTKLQNTGSGPKPPNILVHGNIVKSVDSCAYLGSLQSLDGQRRPDLMSQASPVHSCCLLTRYGVIKCLTLNTKLHVHPTLVLSVLLYAADTWTLLAANVRTLGGGVA